VGGDNSCLDVLAVKEFLILRMLLPGTKRCGLLGADGVVANTEFGAHPVEEALWPPRGGPRKGLRGIYGSKWSIKRQKKIVKRMVWRRVDDQGLRSYRSMIACTTF
jgi:hypothetical protein